MSQPIPTRLKVLQGITSVLKDITPANGYVNDLSDFQDDAEVTRARVFRGRNLFGDSDPLPMVSILENPHTDPNMHASPKWSPLISGPWLLLLQGMVEDDPNNPTDPAHVLMADVKQALAQHRGTGRIAQPNLFGAGRVVGDFVVGTGTVRPPDEWSVYAYFWLFLTVEMVEDMTNPYA